jgi:hypothetical protein
VQLEDQRSRKAQEGHIEEVKTARPNKRHEKWQPKPKLQRKAQNIKSSQNLKTPPESNSP